MKADHECGSCAEYDPREARCTLKDAYMDKRDGADCEYWYRWGTRKRERRTDNGLVRKMGAAILLGKA